MRKIAFCISSFFLGTLLAVALAQTTTVPEEVAEVNSLLKQKYAPDGRIAIFKASYTVDGKNVMVCGETTSKSASKELTSILESKGYKVVNCLKIYPEDNGLGEETWGIVRNSVCNIRSAADYGAENVTQGQMGMPVRIIRKDKWLQVQTPDDYLGWVENAAIQRVTKTELEAWNKADKVVVTALWGQVFSLPSDKSQCVSDVVAGNRLRLLGKKGKYYHVAYADGRKGYISKSICMELDKWRRGLNNSAESILATGKSLIGVPYIWAGLSPKGVDCSGFVRTTLLLHDIIIPRDASQMCLKGDRIEIGDFSQLQPGDLLFFGSRNEETGKERVSHVGFYMGNKRFIHSLGCVHENSFDPESDIYDEYNLNRLLFATRVLPYINKKPGLTTTDKNPYYSSVLKFE